MMLPGRVDIPFAHRQRSGVEARTLELDRRPHNSGPRCPRGASPMRPAHAKPNVVVVAWPDGGQDSQCTSQASPASLGSNKQGPLP
jgi:hypothetical protein